jgi:hypothetical protein
LQLNNKIFEVTFIVFFQPVRTFFHTNKSTCGEWLTRIRTAVVIVAIHAGQATTAVRHGYCMLQDMADANNTQVWKEQSLNTDQIGFSPFALVHPVSSLAEQS